MTDQAKAIPDDPICEYCHSYMSDHDWEHLARYCTPLKLDKERADHAQALAELQAKLDAAKRDSLICGAPNCEPYKQVEQQLARARETAFKEAGDVVYGALAGSMNAATFNSIMPTILDLLKKQQASDAEGT